MAIGYKARKKCLQCKRLFFAEYSGRIYCYDCGKPIPIPKKQYTHTPLFPVEN